jgi:hypothetical protein
MLVELNVVEQRYQAMLEVINGGATVTDVARRSEVSRQTVRVWLRKYAASGLSGLVDGSARPLSCPHQMARKSRRGSWRSAVISPVGVQGRLVTNSIRKVWFRCRVGRRGTVALTDRVGVVACPGESSSPL